MPMFMLREYESRHAVDRIYTSQHFYTLRPQCSRQPTDVASLEMRGRRKIFVLRRNSMATGRVHSASMCIYYKVI